MSLLPTIKRISREDLPNAPDWVSTLIYPINLFMGAVYSALNKNITFNENILCQLKTIEFTTSQAYGTGTTSVDKANNFNVFSYNSTLSTTQNLILSKITQNSSNFVVLTDPITVSWQEINKVIYIMYITGLQPNTTYTATFLSF